MLDRGGMKVTLGLVGQIFGECPDPLREVHLLRGRSPRKNGAGRMDMKRSRHTPEQIVRKLCEADRLLVESIPLAEVMRHLEISHQMN